jgi:cell division protein FtsL
MKKLRESVYILGLLYIIVSVSAVIYSEWLFREDYFTLDNNKLKIMVVIGSVIMGMLMIFDRARFFSLKREVAELEKERDRAKAEMFDMKRDLEALSPVQITETTKDDIKQNQGDDKN